MNFCGGQTQSKKGKAAVQIYNKVDKKDKQIFQLNASRGQKNDSFLIERMTNNQPKASFLLGSQKGDPNRFIDGNLSEYIKRKIAKSEYEELIEKYQKSNDSWTDSQFPATQPSWGTSIKNVVWKRVKDIIKNPKFVENNYSPADILQGRLGNCYFLSAVAGLAEKPYRIKKLFPSYQINKNGIYMARILHKGVYQQVIVDDYFPCNKNGELIGAQPAGGNEIWVMVLQKCWAKLFGSYDAIDGGLPHQVLHAFSTAPTYNYRINKSKDDLEKLWKKILNADQNDQIICCGTQPVGKNNRLQDLGLVGGHAYTVLGVYDQPYRVLKIRNPWGSMEWKGSANDEDEEFWSKITPQEQLRMGYHSGEDGTFFMLWEDFQKYFVIVDICKISDNSQYFYLQDNFQKSRPICYDVKTEGGRLTFTTSQMSKRELKRQYKDKINFKLANATMILGKTNEDLSQFQYVNSKADYSYSDLYMAFNELPKGRYILACYVEGENNKIQSTVSIYGQANVAIMETNINSDDYLHDLYLDHARKNINSRQMLCQQPQQWAVFQILTDNCGFGYSAFHLDPNSKRKLGLQFDESEYEANGLQLLNPFKGSGVFKLVCQKGKQTIILCRLKPGYYASELMMPTPKMYRLR